MLKGLPNKFHAIPILLTLLQPIPAWSGASLCEGRDLKLLFAPSFGPQFLQEYFSDVLQLLRDEQCVLTLYHVKSFADVFGKIKSNQIDVLVIPSLLNTEAKTLGFRWALSGFDGAYGYVIVRRDSQVLRLRGLIGKTIYLNDPQSLMAAEWLRITKEQGLYKKVKVEYGGKMESLLFRLINGEIEATATVNLLYERLSETIKDRLLVIHRNRLTAPSSILLNDQLPLELRQRLTERIESGSQNWATKPEPNYPMDEEFIKELRWTITQP